MASERPGPPAALYRRISTDLRLQRWSLAAQEETLRQLAAARGWPVVADFQDEESGSHAGRPGLQSLLDAMSEGRFARVLVVDQDRLSRLDPIEWELVKRSFREAGCRLVTPAGEVDFGDEDQELISDVFNLFARHQRRKIRKATLRGRAQAMRGGRWLTKAPWGYLRRDGHLLPDPLAAPLVRAIFERYAGGESASRIAVDFARQQVPRPQGGRWDARRVGALLRNPAYKGWAVCRFPGERVELRDAHPPVVDAALWDRCQALAARRRERYRFHLGGGGQGLLAGLLTCGGCGRPLAWRSLQRRKPNGRRYEYAYYRHRHDGPRPAAACTAAHRAEAVDARVLAALAKLALAPEVVRRVADRLAGAGGRARAEAGLRLADRALQGLIRRGERLLDLYLEGACSRDEFTARRQAMTAQIQVQQRLRDELVGLLEVARGDRSDPLAAAGWVAALMGIAGMELADRRRLVQTLCERAEIGPDGALRLDLRLPLGSCPTGGTVP